MATTPSSGLLVSDIDVTINGSALPADALAYLDDMIVDESVELPSMFSFGIASSDLQQQQSPWVDNTDLFSVGNAVEIKMGSSDTLTSLISGEITALEPEFVFNRLPILRVRGYDRRHRLQRGRKTRSFLKQKDSDIASQVGTAAGLTVQATDSGTTLDYVLQANQTDWDFLCERARRIHYEVAVQDKRLLFRPVANGESEVLTLTFEDDLLEFYPRLSSAGQATEVKVQSWSIKDKKAVVGDSKAGDEVSMGGGTSGAAMAQSAFSDAIDVVSDRPVASQAEADQFAKARFNELVLEFISGEGICRGRTDLHAGQVIKIDGIGRRFSGKYYITAAVHRYSPRHGYLTNFVVRRNAS